MFVLQNHLALHFLNSKIFFHDVHSYFSWFQKIHNHTQDIITGAKLFCSSVFNFADCTRFSPTPATLEEEVLEVDDRLTKVEHLLITILFTFCVFYRHMLSYYRRRYLFREDNDIKCVITLWAMSKHLVKSNARFCWELNWWQHNLAIEMLWNSLWTFSRTQLTILWHCVLKNFSCHRLETC